MEKIMVMLMVPFMVKAFLGTSYTRILNGISFCGLIIFFACQTISYARNYCPWVLILSLGVVAIICHVILSNEGGEIFSTVKVIAAVCMSMVAIGLFITNFVFDYDVNPLVFMLGASIYSVARSYNELQETQFRARYY